MIQTQVIPRDRVTPVMNIITLAASLLLGITIVGIIFAVNNVNPFYALGKIFIGSFGSLYGLKETVTKAIPLILMGSGLALAFKGKFWNIGAEGQLLAGAIVASGIALKLGPVTPRYVAVPLMFIGGFLGGGLLGLLPAIFKIKFRINEIISTLMLNYIVAEFVQYLIVGPWKGKTQYGFPYTDDFVKTAQIRLIPGSRYTRPRWWSVWWPLFSWLLCSTKPEPVTRSASVVRIPRRLGTPESTFLNPP